MLTALDVLGEVLIPAVAPANGAAIVQETWRPSPIGGSGSTATTCSSPGGQPAESDLDVGNRSVFADTEIQRFDLRSDPASARPFTR